MVDLPEQAVAFLKAHGYKDVYLKRLDSMTGREGIIIRRLPSTVQGRSYSGARTLHYLYQVIVRSRSEREALEKAEDLANLLDLAPLQSKNGSFAMVQQEIYTPPQELTLSESGFYATEFRVRAEIIL